jgi:hypothetical protein
VSRQGLRRNAAVLSWVIAAAALALGGAPSPADARAIYKCTLADGKTVFSDTPCKETSSQQELQMRGGTAVPSGVAAAPEAGPAAPAAEPGTCPWTPPEREVRVEQPRKIDPEQLPHDASGKPVEIFVGKRGPMSVAGTCSAMVSACSQKSDDPARAMDACFKSAPHCATERPWEEQQACCPQACWEKYADLRHHCVDASSASYKALFEAHCVPGTANVQAQARP